MTDVETLVRVSRLYYELGETQEAIAALTGVTRPHVSRLLKEARAKGVVEIRINRHLALMRIKDKDTFFFELLSAGKTLAGA